MKVEPIIGYIYIISFSFICQQAKAKTKIIQLKEIVVAVANSGCGCTIKTSDLEPWT